MCLSGSPIKVIPGLKKKAIHFVDACLLQWVLLSNAFYLQICAVQICGSAVINGYGFSTNPLAVLLTRLFSHPLRDPTTEWQVSL